MADALAPYRVLDLTDGNAALGPMLLADLGAEVIKVEPPGGLPSRREDGGLPFAAYNRNKRGVTLDLDTDEGREAFRRLAATADFLFENDRPGAMAARGLGFDDLSALNPRLVYVAVTPFGQDGPYAEHLATDLTLSAMGGMVAINGDADRPPVRISVPQAWLHAAAESAVAALVAHQRRLHTGEAQFVDVSVQAAVFWTMLNASIAHAVQGKDIERAGTDVQLGTITVRVMFPCVDGDAVLFLNGGILSKVVPWMVADGVVPDSWLTAEEWPSYDVRLLTGEPITLPLDQITERLEAFARLHTKQALFERGLADGVFVAPASTVADVMQIQQLDARGYWQPLSLPDGTVLRAPGPWARLSRTPISYHHAVPAPGEANGEFKVPSSRLKEAEVTAARPSARNLEPGTLNLELPLAGLKVADFSWIGVGPLTGRYLADHGATTVRVETSSPPDRLRVAGPFKDGVFGHNRSQFFAMANASKQSIALNLKHPAGRAMARRLIAWADVYLESFTPGTVHDLGIDYETARSLNPGIIMVSSCLMGQTGPAAPLAGYGTHAAAISGFGAITGWPDRSPSGPYVAYTDTIAPRFLATAILAALDHRDRTGEGQYIEQSQMESALYFLAPELLRYQMDGTMPMRMGNDSPSAAPHNVYPCLGKDQWCAIAVETDNQWRALRGALGNPNWAMDPALDTAAGRHARREQIDARLGEWTRTMPPHEVMSRLQAAGVPAGAVQRSSDLLHDPQLAHRRFFHSLTHAEMGDVPYEGHQFRIRGYDSGPRFAAPCLGEHTVEVLRDTLALTDDELANIAASGALV